MSGSHSGAAVAMHFLDGRKRCKGLTSIDQEVCVPGLCSYSCTSLPPVQVVPPPRQGDALQAPVSADDMGLPGEGKSQVRVGPHPSSPSSTSMTPCSTYARTPGIILQHVKLTLAVPFPLRPTGPGKAVSSNMLALHSPAQTT
jgi:hypothetical protein